MPAALGRGVERVNRRHERLHDRVRVELGAELVTVAARHRATLDDGRVHKASSQVNANHATVKSFCRQCVCQAGHSRSSQFRALPLKKRRLRLSANAMP